MNGQQTDIPDDFAPIEAVQYRFSGPVRNKYDIYYTTTLNDGTQTGWAGNGHSAGTMNTGKLFPDSVWLSLNVQAVSHL